MATDIKAIVIGIEEKLDIVFEEAISKYMVESEADPVLAKDPKDIKVKATEFGDKDKGKPAGWRKEKDGKGQSLQLDKGTDFKGAKDAGDFNEEDGEGAPVGGDATPAPASKKLGESVGNWVPGKNKYEKGAVNQGDIKGEKKGDVKVGGFANGAPVEGKAGKVKGNADEGKLGSGKVSSDNETKDASEAGFGETKPSSETPFKKFQNAKNAKTAEGTKTAPNFLKK